MTALIASLPGTLWITWSSESVQMVNGDTPGHRNLVIDTGAVLMFPMAAVVDRRLDYLDIEALWNSVERPGCHRIVNCACGYPSCAGVDRGIDVAHPDDDTVVWDIDVEGMEGVFPQPAPWGEQRGVVRLTFTRSAYERNVREFARAMRLRASAPLPWDAIGCLESASIDRLRAEFPSLQAVPIGLWLPDGDGDELERLLAMDPEAPFRRGEPPLS